MPRLFVGNFDFEHRLARGEGTLPQNVARVNADLPPIWAALATDGDAVWTPRPIDPGVFDRLAGQGLPRLRPVIDPAALSDRHTLVFWGENAWAEHFARRGRQYWNGCDSQITRRVNSRRFKFDLELRFGVLPADSALTTSVEELTEAVHGPSQRTAWVLKGEFGGAGREVRFCGARLSEADFAWANTRFRRRLAVMIEPRLDTVEEVGVQFRVERSGTVAFDGVTPLISRPNGSYVGSRFADDPALPTIWAEAIEIGRQVAETVAAEGYFGPLGIDAMRFRDAAGMIRLRPLQDLNARYTMGRIALGLRRFPKFVSDSGGLFRLADFRAVEETR